MILPQRNSVHVCTIFPKRKISWYILTTMMLSNDAPLILSDEEEEEESAIGDEDD